MIRLIFYTAMISIFSLARILGYQTRQRIVRPNVALFPRDSMRLMMAVRREKSTEVNISDESDKVKSDTVKPKVPSLTKATPLKLRIKRKTTSDGIKGEDSDQKTTTPSSKSKKVTATGPKTSNFVTVKLGTDADIQNAEMEERLRDAKNWVSKRLTDEEAGLLNRAMGIESEIMDALESEEGSEVGKKKRSRSSKQSSSPLKLAPISKEEYTAAMSGAAAVKGFLEINPYLCSGCGAPFQSKTSDSPGYLPPDKLQTHRRNSVTIREKQEAIKILELAGMEVDSPAAAELLREANVSPEVIEGVRLLGRGERGNVGWMQSDEDEAEEDMDADEINEYEDDDEDLLDGLELDLDALMGMIDSGEVCAGSTESGSDTVAKGLIQAISKGVESRAGGKDAASLDLLNDIDDEIASGGKTVIRRGSISVGDLSQIGSKSIRPSRKDPTAVSATSSFSEPVCICQRCFRLNQYGQVEQSLRPGWSKDELLSPQRFEQLLQVVQETNCIVLCIVDLFDLQGSLLRNLKQIAGKNTIVIAANKLDLLPKDASQTRLLSWVHSEVKEVCGLTSPKEAEESRDSEIRARGYRRVSDNKELETGVLRRGNVHLISSQSGTGVDKLLTSLIAMASDSTPTGTAAGHGGNKIYVMGAANVGKSSFINRLLTSSYGGGNKKRPDTPQATVSNLPGTTLDFLKIRLPNGVTVIDTPGLLNPGQLTAKLTTAELRQIIPSKPINAVTLRVSEGKCVLMGGIASIEILEGRPFFMTFFISNEVKLHPTDAAKREEFLAKHAGTLVTPPSSPERLAELGPFQAHDFTIRGEDWKTAQSDLVIAGLGWVSITGPGECKVRVIVPNGVSVGVRGALLPYEATHSTARFTGGRLEKKSRKPGAKQYGWRK